MQTGGKIDSPVPGKKQNCTEFGTFVPQLASNDPMRALCHGGYYKGDFWDPCDVRPECRLASARRVEEGGEVLVNPASLVRRTPQDVVKSSVRQEALPFTPLTVRDFNKMGTTIPRAGGTPQQQAAQGAQQARNPRVFYPPPNSPPGMRTPYVESDAWGGEASPSWTPKEGESPWDRMFLNVIQGIISIIGYHIWQFTRRIDLFS